MFNDSFKQFYKFFNFFDILFIYSIINKIFNLNGVYFNIIINFIVSKFIDLNFYYQSYKKYFY